MAECREQGGPRRANLLPAEVIMDRVLQDPLEQHRQLGCGPIRVMLGELQHRVLDDIDGRVLVADGEHRLLEGTPLDVRQQARDFLLRGQFESVPGGRGDYRRMTRIATVSGIRCASMLQRSNHRLDRRPVFPVLSRLAGSKDRLLCCNKGRLLSSLRTATSGNEFPWSRPCLPQTRLSIRSSLRARAQRECDQKDKEPSGVLSTFHALRGVDGHITHEALIMELTGAEILIRCLQEEGVEYVFGYPGGAVLNIYDELFKQTRVKHVLVRHEQGAVHAADGYSRSSHKVGVALVTSGPGVTNAVTGIATAYMDSIPLVMLTGQVPTAAIGQDAFQECDTVGITRPCVKHNYLVKNVADIAVTMKKAFYLATTGRPGPVLVDIPKDVSQALTE